MSVVEESEKESFILMQLFVGQVASWMMRLWGLLKETMLELDFDEQE